jgi:GntR family transcriptional regulator/MocR family aminotransferase
VTEPPRSRGRQAYPAELLTEIRRDSSQPLRLQLEVALRNAIRAGRLASGSRLPSSRTLAADLGVSRSVVVEAYDQLVIEGYLSSRPRSGISVADRAPRLPGPPTRDTPAPPPQHDLRPGVPDLGAFPMRDWMRSLREAVAALPRRRLGYGDAQGAFELRDALADYLSRARGLDARPERIVVVNGFAQGLGLLCAVLRAEGATTLLIEDPSSPRQRAFIARSGLALHPVEVDTEGARTDALPAVQGTACLVTPAHQYPMGVVLSPNRRRELLEWAHANHSIVIEDDYDAEFRYDRAPVGAMQGLDPERVIYAGSASKTLAPGLRLGWLVLPERFTDAIAAAKHDADLGSPILEQVAFARMLESGRFERHVRRSRDLYRRRRDALVEAVHDLAPAWTIGGVAAGLHFVATGASGTDDVTLAGMARARGVAVEPLSSYTMHAELSGLILGYGRLLPESASTVVRRLLGA